MVSNKFVNKEIKTVYLDLIDTFGYYRTRPNKEPYICLSLSLLDEKLESIHRDVYAVLLDFHKSQPGGNCIPIAPVTTYYEALVPPEGIPQSGPEVEIIGRAIRRWYTFAKEETRVIG